MKIFKKNKIKKPTKQEQYQIIINDMKLKYKNGEIPEFDMFGIGRYIIKNYNIVYNISELMAIHVNVYDGNFDMTFFK